MERGEIEVAVREIFPRMDERGMDVLVDFVGDALQRGAEAPVFEVGAVQVLQAARANDLARLRRFYESALL